MNKESLNLINAFLYSILVAFTSFSFIYILPLFIVVFYERKNLFKLLKKLLYLNFFIVILTLFVAFENQSEALNLFVKINSILFFNISLFHKSKGYDIVRALNSLKFSSKIVSVSYFTLSLIDYLMQDFRKTQDSLKLRGFKNKTSIFTYQTYGNIFAMIFIKAIKKSEDMRDSMILRGFEDKIYFLDSKKIDNIQKIVFITILLIFLKVVYELLG